MTETELRKLMILLVEDNAADVYMVREALSEADISHELHVLRNGDEALAFLRKAATPGGQRPDLIILDLNLPGKNGRQLMREMTTDAALRSMPVAIFSTSESECGIGRDFPELRTTFEAKTSSFDRLISIVKRFRDFAEKSA